MKTIFMDADMVGRTATAMIGDFHIAKKTTPERAKMIADQLARCIKHQILGRYMGMIEATCMDAEPDKVDAGPEEPDTSAVVSNEASKSDAPYLHVNLQINMHPSAKIFGVYHHHTGGTININTDGRPESIAQAALAVGKILGPWPEEG